MSGWLTWTYHELQFPVPCNATNWKQLLALHISASAFKLLLAEGRCTSPPMPKVWRGKIIPVDWWSFAEVNGHSSSIFLFPFSNQSAQVKQTRSRENDRSMHWKQGQCKHDQTLQDTHGEPWAEGLISIWVHRSSYILFGCVSLWSCPLHLDFPHFQNLRKMQDWVRCGGGAWTNFSEYGVCLPCLHFVNGRRLEWEETRHSLCNLHYFFDAVRPCPTLSCCLCLPVISSSKWQLWTLATITRSASKGQRLIIFSIKIY